MLQKKLGGTINLKDLPQLKALPSVSVPGTPEKKLVDFAATYGRCMRQLSNRQTTTKARAGTLQSCYDNNYQGEETVLHVEVRDSEEYNSEYSSEEDDDFEVNEIIHGDLEAVPRGIYLILGHTSKIGRSVRVKSKFFRMVLVCM